MKARDALLQGKEQVEIKPIPVPAPIKAPAPIVTKHTITEHKPLGFINKSNMIRFVIPTVMGICIGSMLQGTFGNMPVFILIFGILGVAGAVMSS